SRDWSSDVCSSDLGAAFVVPGAAVAVAGAAQAEAAFAEAQHRLWGGRGLAGAGRLLVPVGVGDDVTAVGDHAGFLAGAGGKGGGKGGGKQQAGGGHRGLR